MDGVYIESHCIIGAGALLTKNRHILKGSIVMGAPGKIVKICNEQQLKSLFENAKHYIDISKVYKKEE